MGRKALTKEQFVNKSREFHGDKYDYSLVNYVNAHTKVKIIDKSSNTIFEQMPYLHLRGHGNKIFEIASTEDFIKYATDRYGNKYDYSLVEFVDYKTKVKIIHPKYGIFEQLVSSHLSGNGFPKQKFLKEILIDKINESYPNKYDCSKIEYINNITMVKLIDISKNITIEKTPHRILRDIKALHKKEIKKIIFKETGKRIKNSEIDRKHNYYYSLLTTEI